MRFKLTDWIDFYRLPSNVYSLELFVTQLTPKEYFGFVEKLRYYTKKMVYLIFLFLALHQVKVQK